MAHKLLNAVVGCYLKTSYKTEVSIGHSPCRSRSRCTFTN